MAVVLPHGALFIDASAYFEKAKNQNFLQNDDMDKIVATYRDRLQEEKYSYCAPLLEVAKNNFKNGKLIYSKALYELYYEDYAIRLQISWTNKNY